MSFNQISFGEPKRNESPSINVKPPTESGNPPSALTDIRCETVRPSNTTHNWLIPSGRIAGDLIFVIINGDDLTGISVPSGYTQWTSTPHPTNHLIFWKVSDGTESDTTYTTTNSTELVFTSGRIPSNGATLPTPEQVNVNIDAGASTSIDPAAITPSAGAGTYHFIVAVMYNRGGPTPDDEGGLSAGYSHLTTCTLAGQLLEPGLYLQHKPNTTIVTTEDPGVMSWDASGTSRIYTMWTISVSAAGAPSPLAHTHTEDEVTDHTTLTQKATPVVADVLLGYDSENAFAKTFFTIDDLPGVSGSLPTATTKGDLAVYDGSAWVRVGTGANDTVLTADSAQTAGVKWAAGGGGGGSATISPTPAASDEFSDGSWGGTTVDPASPTTSVRESDGRLSVAHPGGDAAAEMHAYLIPHTPAGNFVVTASLIAFRIGNAFSATQTLGVMATDGTTHGAGNQIATLLEGQANRVDMRRFTGYDTQAAIDTGDTIAGTDERFRAQEWHVALQYTSSTNLWKGFYSIDGISWFAGANPTELTSSAITVTHVGPCITTWGSADPLIGSFGYVRAYDDLLSNLYNVI